MMERERYMKLKKEKLTILALGPMTNIATLIQNHPDIIPQIEKISIVARTHQSRKRQTECFDYNYEFDYKSMDVVLNSPIPLVLQVMSQFLHFIGILIWLV
jgi:pyrimidine-specific ribonucleoside hydrolase